MNRAQDLIRQAVEQGRVTYAGLSRAIGKNLAYVQQFVERDTPKALPEEAREVIARMIGVSPDDLRAMPKNPLNSRGDVRAAQPLSLAPRFGSLPEDVPVLGFAAGGDTHADFYLNGETVRFVKRPPSLSSVVGVYALYINGESMMPRYRPGEMVFVNPTQPPSIGDDVIVQLKPGDEQHEVPGFIKELRRRTPTRFVCYQYNPEQEVSFERDTVLELHRVVPLAELLG